MAVTSSVPRRGLWVAGGVVAGVFGACVVALFTAGLSELFGGSGQELFNAGILGFAVLMLGWHNYGWRDMAAKWRRKCAPPARRSSPARNRSPRLRSW